MLFDDFWWFRCDVLVIFGGVSVIFVVFLLVSVRFLVIFGGFGVSFDVCWWFRYDY